MKPVSNQPKSNEGRKISVFYLFRYRPFMVLAIPNLLRGFFSGLIALAVTIGYFTGHLNADGAAVLLVITQLVSLAGSLCYTLFAGKEGSVLLASSILAALCLFFMSLFNTTFFLIFYGVAYFFVAVINVAVPAAVARLIDYEVAGQYNGWRMLLTTFGTFLASLVCVPLLQKIGVVAVIGMAGVGQVICGIVYFCYIRIRSK